MKLSNKVIPVAAGSGVESWLPTEFNTHPALPVEGRVEDLLALFKLSPERTAHPPASALQPRRADVAAWQPDELEWTPPFNAADWFGLDGLPDAGIEGDGEVQQDEPGHKDHLVSLRAAEEEAASILAQARKQAEEVMIQAQQSVDDAVAQAQDELANAKGDGYRQGWTKAGEEAASILQAAQEIVLQFAQWRDGMFAQSEAMIVEMVKQMGKTMFGDGLELEPKAMEANLNRVVENAKSLGDLKVYLNPFDADKLDPAWREYQQLISGNRVQIIPSDGIKPGGCFVQGQMGTVDARVETQLKAVLEVFDQEDVTEELA